MHLLVLVLAHTGVLTVGDVVIRQLLDSLGDRQWQIIDQWKVSGLDGKLEKDGDDDQDNR